MKNTYDLKDSCISHNSIEDILEKCVSMDDLLIMRNMVDCLLMELSAKRSLSNTENLSYLETLLYKDGFEKGYAAAHAKNHKII